MSKVEKPVMVYSSALVLRGYTFRLYFGVAVRADSDTFSDEVEEGMHALRFILGIEFQVDIVPGLRLDALPGVNINATFSSMHRGTLQFLFDASEDHTGCRGQGVPPWPWVPAR